MVVAHVNNLLSSVRFVSAMASSRKLRVAICHPDLGIGGAERLIVDAALELTALGHHVHVFTAHHDPKRCFEETVSGNFPVTVYGSFLPRHVFNRFHAVCAYVRCLYVALCVVLFWPAYDVALADQVSAVIPLLKLKRNAKVLLYCHFPDLLLAPHSTRLRKMYRWPIDLVEERTTGMADLVLVNSEFTASIFGTTFKSLERKGLYPAVLYPAVDVDQFSAPGTADSTSASQESLEKLGLPAGSRVFLSINRFERKKNLRLAISAFSRLLEQLSQCQDSGELVNIRLVVAGGYDPRLSENREYFNELNSLAQQEGVTKQVLFLPSCSTSERNMLLHASICVIYTPMEEHFGIVPLEAMAAGKPVVACNSGGPKESIRHGVTGLLCEPTPQSFCQAMSSLLTGPEKARSMGIAARQHVQEHFSRKVFGIRLDKYLRTLVSH